MKPLTRRDMYDKDGKCILLKEFPKRYKNRNKYDPATEDKKHRKI